MPEVWLLFRGPFWYLFGSRHRRWRKGGPVFLRSRKREVQADLLSVDRVVQAAGQYLTLILGDLLCFLSGWV